MARNYRIQPILMDDQPCDGVWTDGIVAWIGQVQAFTFLMGGRKTVVLPLTDTSGAYVPAPQGWQSCIIERWTRSTAAANRAPQPPASNTEAPATTL